MDIYLQLGTWPSLPRNASCQRQPSHRRACAQTRKGPSTCRQASCRPGLYDGSETKLLGERERERERSEKLTERDTRVLLADLVTVVVGEEHVRGQTTLGSVGVWVMVSVDTSLTRQLRPRR